jgi:hypothetical protein
MLRLGLSCLAQLGHIQTPDKPELTQIHPFEFLIMGQASNRHSKGSGN